MCTYEKPVVWRSKISTGHFSNRNFILLFVLKWIIMVKVAFASKLQNTFLIGLIVVKMYYCSQTVSTTTLTSHFCNPSFLMNKS